MTHKFHCWVFTLEKEELKFMQIPIHEYIDITALFIVMVKIWKQLKYTSMSKWINKSWYITWIEYYSVIKKNILLIIATTWLNSKGIMLNEKKPISKEYIWNDSIYITFLEEKYCRDEEQISTIIWEFLWGDETFFILIMIIAT